MDIEDGHTNESTKYHVTELIIGVASYDNDSRYCSKPNCRCSPETSIKHHYEQIKKYIKGTTGCLYPIPTKYIEEIIKGMDRMTVKIGDYIIDQFRCTLHVINKS